MLDCVCVRAVGSFVTCCVAEASGLAEKTSGWGARRLFCPVLQKNKFAGEQRAHGYAGMHAYLVHALCMLFVFFPLTK